MMSRGGDQPVRRGDLDEVAIYDRALDAATIAAHYAGNPTAADRLLHDAPEPGRRPARR